METLSTLLCKRRQQLYCFIYLKLVDTVNLRAQLNLRVKDSKERALAEVVPIMPVDELLRKEDMVRNKDSYHKK